LSRRAPADPYTQSVKRIAASTVAALACASAAQAAAVANTASVTASTYDRGKPVALTFDLTYRMPCGAPGKTMTVLMPAGMKVPARINRRAVLVNGAPAGSVATQGSTVSISLARKQWITCNVLGPGTLSVVLGSKAGLANPGSPGIYRFPLAIGSVHGTPQLRIN
jgi:hypothetical protein